MAYKTGIIILAAGSSSRLGQPKQLLQYGGQSLIRRIASHATANNEHAVVVVTGANGDAIEKEAEGLQILTCRNDNWALGMGSSIAAGLKQLLLAYPDILQCIICVSDQPYVTNTVLQNIKNEQVKSGNGIIASLYSGTAGVPALFTKPFFDALLGLAGHEGAKKVILKYSDDVSLLSFEKGAIDIDTMDDYNQLTQ